MKDLYSHCSAQDTVVTAPDHAHTASTDRFDEAVSSVSKCGRPEQSAGQQFVMTSHVIAPLQKDVRQRPGSSRLLAYLAMMSPPHGPGITQ
jgi:hypothetical protein